MVENLSQDTEERRKQLSVNVKTVVGGGGEVFFSRELARFAFQLVGCLRLRLHDKSATSAVGTVVSQL